MRCPKILYGVAFVLLALAGVCAAEPIPLEILEPPARTETVQDYPVSLGLLFPDGELTSPPGGAVEDDLGSPIPFDWEVTGWWSAESNSVKWLLLHFQASSDRTYSFVPGAAPAVPPGDPLATANDCPWRPEYTPAGGSAAVSDGTSA